MFQNMDYLALKKYDKKAEFLIELAKYIKERNK